VGLLVGVGELLAEGDGLGVGLLDGVGEGWLAIGEGWLGVGEAAPVEATGVGEDPGTVVVAVGLLFTAAAPVTGVADEATAIMTPVTTATMPPTTPATRNTTVQVEAGRVPGTGPSPAKEVPLSWGGLARAASLPVPGRRPRKG
jgi:hypothetical protein